LAGPVVVNGLLSISAGVLDLGTYSLSGPAGLNMTGGTLRIAKKGTVVPELTGVSNPYSISGGSLELYGTEGFGETQILRSTFNLNSPVSYFNIALNSNGENLTNGNIVPQGSIAVTGAMEVNSPVVLQLANTKVVTGNNFILNYCHPVNQVDIW